MKEQGFIRKIDELGRVVIPKEIRNQLKIKDNENIHIELIKENVIIKKYSYLINYNNYLESLANTFYEVYKIPIKIKDNDNLVISVGIINDKLNITAPIYNNSVQIGTLSLYAENNEHQSTQNLCKLLSKIISIYLNNSWFYKKTMINYTY